MRAPSGEIKVLRSSIDELSQTVAALAARVDGFAILANGERSYGVFIATENKLKKAPPPFARLRVPVTREITTAHGDSLASLAKKVRVGVDRVIACHDDIDLPFGVLHVKQGGSTAGHQGLNSMVQAFGSKDFYRVRLGVGRPPGRQDPADYVLELFAPRERDEVAVLVQEAADAVRTIGREGLAAAQDRFNRRRA